MTSHAAETKLVQFTPGLSFNVGFAEAGGKWQVCLVMDDGRMSLSDQVYNTREEAEGALTQWVNEIGATVQRIN
jgi:hypothetical protein